MSVVAKTAASGGSRLHPEVLTFSSSLEADRSLPIVLNAANEVAVAAFLEGRLRFPAISDVIGATMDAHTPSPVDTLAAVRAVDTWSRAHAAELVRAVESN